MPMKMLTFTLVFALGILNLYGQDITGQWNGILKVQGVQLRIVFHISKSGIGYTSTMDSPDQKANGIPVTSTSFENNLLKLSVANASINYEGTLDPAGSVTGSFSQGGQSFAMNLTREVLEKKGRPQEPVKPFPYFSEDLVFDNAKAGIQLAGTLTLPGRGDGRYPAVILISGSGPQNRDEELLGHKPFLVLSDYLTRNGIAVLRYDDRGTALSKGDFRTATTRDLAGDVGAAVQYLLSRKEIDPQKIGLCGHSEGGIIAPMVAAGASDISFIVLMAGTGIPGNELLLRQNELIGRASGASEADLAQTRALNKLAFDMIRTSTDTSDLEKKITDHIQKTVMDNPRSGKPARMSEQEFVNLQVQQLTSPWMTFFIKYDPAPALEKVTCPVLALNGERDLQVPAKVNLEAIQNALARGGNKRVTVKELPNLNHLFQESVTGSPSEYATIEQTLSPLAMDLVTKWILEVTR